MKEKFYINIPEPCHEDWNKMTPVEQGRHCAVCKKNVVDFSDKDDEALLVFFKNYNGNTCGRFSDEQLNRPLSKFELKPASRFLRLPAGLLLPALILNKSNAQKKDTVHLKEIIVTGSRSLIGKVMTSLPIAGPIQIQKSDTFVFKPIKQDPIEKLLSAKSSCYFVPSHYSLHGKVIEVSTGFPVAGATVLVSGTKNGTVTGEDGSFLLNTENKSVELIITSIGYNQKEIQINTSKNDTLTIKLSPRAMGLSEVVIDGIASKKNKYVTGTGSVKTLSSKRKFHDSIRNIFLVHQISIYPNPVTSNGTITVSFEKVKPGQYQIRLLNTSGQLFYSFQKQVSAVNETELIHLNERMSAGVYMLQIIDGNNKLVQTNKIIIQ